MLETELPFYTLTVDTEEEWDWADGYTTDPTKVSNIRGLQRFQRECESHGAKVTYFVNYAVMSDPESVEIIKELGRSENCEIGLHYHPWNTPPLSKQRQVSVRESYLANLDWDIAKQKIDSILDLFAKAGIQPKSFRGGRYSTSLQIQEYLFSRGIESDCSIFPYCKWEDEGSPDYSKRGYSLVRKTFGSSSKGFWELPLTRGFTSGNWDRMSKLFNLLESKPWKYLRLIGLMQRTGLCERVWLNFEEELGAKNLLLLPAIYKRKAPINFTLHSSSLIAGASVYVKDDEALETLYRNLRATLQKLKSDAVYHSSTVSELVNNLEGKFHANTRH